MSQTLSSKTVTGVKWTTFSSISTSVMQIGYTAIMARLLDPESFGVVAMAGVILRFGTYFANMGLAQAIVQKQDLNEKEIRAAFTCAIFLGLCFFGIIWLAAPMSQLIFDTPEVVKILRVMALSFFISGFSSTSLGLLRRQMDFKTLAIVEIASFVLAYLFIGVSLALLGFGVWSLIVTSLSYAFFIGVLAYFFTRHNIQFIFQWSYYKSLFSYGSRASLISFLEFINGNMDTLIIGHFLGKARLGIYNRAYNVLYLPMFFLSTSLSKVIFPSFSKLQTEKEKLGKVYLSSATVIAAIVIPVAAGVMVASKEIVLILLGEKFKESIPVLQIICVAIPLSMITMFAGIVCDATANLRRKIILNIMFMVILSSMFFLLKGYDVIGFALAIALGEIFRTFMYMFVVEQVLSVGYRKLLSMYIPGIINGIVVGSGIFLITYLLRHLGLSIWIVFPVQAATGAVLLFILLFIKPNSILKPEIDGFISKFNLNNNKYYKKLFPIL